MKPTFFIFALLAASLNVHAKATDITQLFLGDYSGKFEESVYHENFVISPDGTTSFMNVRQVGGIEGSAVPYPTVCSFVYKGKITSVEKRTLADRNEYMDYATHIITIRGSEFLLTNELEGSTLTNPDCQTFFAEQQARFTSNGGYFKIELYSELLNKTSFRIHTSGGGDYVPGGPRTPSTLDEVFSEVP